MSASSTRDRNSNEVIVINEILSSYQILHCSARIDNGKYEGIGKEQYDHPFIGYCLYCSWKGGKKNGIGFLKDNNNCDILKVTFKDDLLEGPGYIYQDGKLVFSGIWKEGIICGYCTEYYEDGTVKFIGMYNNNRRNGYGCAFSSKGDLQYSGWFNWKKPGYPQSGTGYYYDSETNRIQTIFRVEDGHCKYVMKSFMNEYMTEYYDNCEVVKYYGEYTSTRVCNRDNQHEDYYTTDYLRHGKGCIYDKSGRMLYQGDFVNGVIDGYGRFYEDSLRYDGAVKDGKREGVGCSYYQSGSVLYEGEWVKNECNGNGKCFDQNGCKICVGRWRHNVYRSNGLFVRIGGTIHDPNKEILIKTYYSFRHRMINCITDKKKYCIRCSTLFVFVALLISITILCVLLLYSSPYHHIMYPNDFNYVSAKTIRLVLSGAGLHGLVSLRFSRTPHLQELTIFHNCCNSVLSFDTASLKELRVLSIIDNSLNSLEQIILSDLLSLESLFISNHSLLHLMQLHFQRLPSLSIISISQYSLQRVPMFLIEDCTVLADITIHSSLIHCHTLHIQHCLQLAHVSVFGESFSQSINKDKGEVAISNCLSLKEIIIEGNCFVNYSILLLKDLPALTMLSIGSVFTSQTTSAFNRLSQFSITRLPSLTHLVLGSNVCSSVDSIIIEELPSLRTILLGSDALMGNEHAVLFMQNLTSLGIFMGRHGKSLLNVENVTLKFIQQLSGNFILFESSEALSGVKHLIAEDADDLKHYIEKNR